MDTKFKTDKFALLSDLRNPYVTLGTHPEWRGQFTKAINSRKVQRTLAEKLSPVGPFLLCYTKIIPDRDALLDQAGLPPETVVCVVSSVGEHAITPWMIVHNAAHSIFSWHMSVKKDIVRLLGLDPTHYSIVANQAELVKCTAARKGLIPNMNELIYELFTTWVWSGKTQSGVAELAAYCDRKFPEVLDSYRGRMVWHRYRCPTKAVYDEVPALRVLLTEPTTAGFSVQPA